VVERAEGGGPPRVARSRNFYLVAERLLPIAQAAGYGGRRGTSAA